ncbi:SMI1/KNR4 family protein [Streptomyces sp. A7024]|uniref:SMI1/KNR4 family protein n=1 Tax=Streptomyces coryli TaxID=1128680 RepID=A0A6G4U7R0_9ACTN|nr:SMI1/KNR4 family protein [Streptomyces coryli]NGN68269.1 SMI1/KNR4 family protein [Streptomyces coryli]
MTDALIGTQKPARRITDPDEAIAALEHAVPGLTDHRRPAPAVIDWAVLEDDLGTALPDDFKLLAERFPSFVLGDFLLVAFPRPGKELYRLRGIREDLEGVLQTYWEEEMSCGLRPHPAPGGLLPWAESNEGDMFLWTTTGPTPQQWRVTVASRNGGWWHYDGSAVQFLTDYCTGTLKLWALPPLNPQATPC